MDIPKRISVSFRYKGKHFCMGEEFKTEEHDGHLTLGQMIGQYIDEQLDYLNEREEQDDDELSN